MTAAKPRRTSSRNLLLASVTTLVLLGFGGLILAITLGFEQPPTALFLTSALLLFAAPVGVLAHLCLTRQLGGDDKKAWARALLGRRAVHSFSLYLRMADRKAAIQALRTGPRDA